jgi:hypothetical protein
MAREDDSIRDADVTGIYWRDEILQLMFWLSGEGLAPDASAGDLRRFLDTDPGGLEARLEHLVQEGYLEPCSGEPRRYRLSVFGSAEGRRRFVEEFSPMLGRESHLVCGDPTCDCHRTGEACPRVQDSHQS